MENIGSRTTSNAKAVSLWVWINHLHLTVSKILGSLSTWFLIVTIKYIVRCQ